jgi:glutamate-1-semialdehyde 2,1-aminomutase
MNSIVNTYIQRHPRSAKLAEQGSTLIPGGVTHDVRYVLPFSPFIKKAAGPLKWDVDNNEYFDFVLGHGSLILGHGNALVEKALFNALGRGTHFGGEAEDVIVWAELVKVLIPSVEKVKFTSSGTEATMLALRLARAFTGRDKIVMFSFHFHGWHDHVAVKGGGIPDCINMGRVILPPNRLDLLENVLSKGDIAAVIIEPTGAAYGAFPLNRGFNDSLRELTSRFGVLLIYDEIVTGFRLSPSGAQGLQGIKPDLTTLAKCLGGGLPVGAVGGRSEVMDLLSFSHDQAWNINDRVYHPGTFNANPISAAAGVAALNLLSNGEAQIRAAESSIKLRCGLNRIFDQLNLTGCAYGDPSIFHLLLGVKCPEFNNCDRINCSLSADAFTQIPFSNAYGFLDLKRASIVKTALLNKGLDLMGCRSGFLSSAHSDRDIEKALEAFEEAFAELKREEIL